jgi:hypothetical protein
MTELNPQPLPPRANLVRVHVPTTVAYDLEKLQKVTTAVLEKLGCGGCHSGRTLEFVHLDEFVVEPGTLEVKEVIGRPGS